MKECNQCGKCCTKYGGGDLAVTAVEVDYWETFRPDIWRYARDGNIWVDPETGKTLEACPWLRQSTGIGAGNGTTNAKPFYSCTIYDDRPDDCRHYPSRISEMIRDECEMIEVKDLGDQGRAQDALDRMMADSRRTSE